MSTRVVRTRYQQYKRDTREISTWLARAAVQHGFPITSLALSAQSSEDDSIPLTAAQKKNAAKKAKSKAKAKAQSLAKSEEVKGSGLVVEDGERPNEGLTLEKGTYEMKTHQYVELASFLVQKDVTVPVEVFRLLKRCISLRQSVTRRFYSASTGSEENEGHQHFINILIEVGSILRASGNGMQEGKDEAMLGNRFADLDVEGEGEEDLADIQLPKPPSAPNAPSASRLSFTREVDLGEGVSSFLAFMEDVDTVRDYLKDLWQDYKVGGVDVMTAAVTTNTALELLRKSHDDIVKRVLQPLNYDLAQMILVSMSMLRGELFFQVPVFVDVSDDDILTTSLYDFFMFPVFQILNGQADLFEDGAIPIYRPGHFGYYDTNPGPLAKQSFRKRWHQSQILMAESFTDYLFLIGLGGGTIGRGEQNAFFFDQTVLEMHKFSKTKEPTLFLMIVSQVFLDINLVMGTAVKRGSADLQTNAIRMVKGFEERRIVEAGARPDTWVVENETIIKRFIGNAGYWSAGEPLSKMRRHLGGKYPLAGFAPGTKSLLFERAPVLCGLVLFRLHLEYQDIGIKLANTWASIMYTTHLFEACRHSGTVPGDTFPSWPDMDLMKRLHGEADIFRGEVPKNLDESQYSFLLVGGASKDAIATMMHMGTAEGVPSYLINRKKPLNLISKDGARTLKDHAQILPIFGARYAQAFSSETHLDITVIEKLLSDISIHQQREIADNPKAKQRPLRRNRKHRSPKFSIVQLLAVLEAGLRYETLSIRFDYIAMHTRCLRVLKIVEKGAHDYLMGKFGPMYSCEGAMLPAVVGLILQVATMSARATELYMGVSSKSELLKSKTLVQATKGIGKYLKESREGHAETRRLEMGRG